MTWASFNASIWADRFSTSRLTSIGRAAPVVANRTGARRLMRTNANDAANSPNARALRQRNLGNLISGIRQSPRSASAPAINSPPQSFRLSSSARTESRDGNRFLENAAAAATATAIPIAPHNNRPLGMADAARRTNATAPQMKNQTVTNAKNGVN